MILRKGRLTLYPVDLIGAVSVIGLGFAAWWLVVLPWQETWQDYRECAAQRTNAEVELRGDVAELETYGEELARLRTAVEREARQVPREDSLPRLLSRMTDIARDANIELLNVEPQSALPEGPYVVNDIQVTGRGHSRDFIRFLDEIARRNPYQALQSCSIRRPVGAADAGCELRWTVRFYMLPALADTDRMGES